MKVHPINIPLPVRFACLEKCDNCCRAENGYVRLSAEEVTRISGFFDIPADLFLDQFTFELDGMVYLRSGQDECCIFLDDHLCTIYEQRPSQCRMYPFWPENMRSEAGWQMTCKTCPGIGQGKTYSGKEIHAIQQGQSLDSDRQQ